MDSVIRDMEWPPQGSVGVWKRWHRRIYRGHIRAMERQMLAVLEQKPGARREQVNDSWELARKSGVQAGVPEEEINQDASHALDLAFRQYMTRKHGAGWMSRFRGK